MQSKKLHIPDNIDLNEMNHRQPDKQNKAPGFTITLEDLKLPDELFEQLPPTVKNYLNYASPLTDAPDEFLLTPFLAITGALIGKKRWIELGGNNIYPIVWTVIFAGSSTFRKTTAQNKAKKPFDSVHTNWKLAYKANLEEWNRKAKEAEENKEKFKEPPPKLKTLYCSDGFSDLTFWEMLRDNGNLISVANEFTALWIELTRSRNAMQDLALQLFDADSVRRNTRMGGDIQLETPIWCLTGATTITAFQRSLTATERGSGLLQRILPVTIEERTKPFKAMTELPKPNAELYERLNANMEAVSRLHSAPVSLSKEAEVRFTAWSYELHERTLKLEKQISDIGGYLSRLNTYGLKFALIFQTLDQPDQPISAGNMQASISLCEWLFNHIIYMLERNYIFNRFYADRLKIREILKKNGGAMNRTDLMNHSHMDKEQLDRALDNEMEAGYIETIETPTGGRPIREYKYKGGA